MTMVNRKLTEQEKFWAGEFGNDYIDRNIEEGIVASNSAMFAKILARTSGIKSCVEFGANIGLNLRAIKRLIPGVDCSGVELNEAAAKLLQDEIGIKNVFTSSIFDVELQRKYDFSLIKGVLIHLNPELLNLAYDQLYKSSSRYILICEYYNPSPVTISYRGHEDRLFKRDFAGEFMKQFPDTHLIDYGFVYHADPIFPLDDVTWFLMEKGSHD